MRSDSAGHAGRGSAAGASGLFAVVISGLVVTGRAARSGDGFTAFADVPKGEEAPVEIHLERSGGHIELDDSAEHEAIHQLKATKRRLEKIGGAPVYAPGKSMRLTNRTPGQLRESLRTMEHDHEVRKAETEFRKHVQRCGVPQECLEAMEKDEVSEDAMAVQFALTEPEKAEPVEEQRCFAPPQDKKRNVRLRACDAAMMFLQNASDLRSRMWAGEVDKATYKGNKFIFERMDPDGGRTMSYSVVALDKLVVKRCAESTKQLDLFHMCYMAKVGRWAEVDLHACREEDDQQAAPAYGEFWAWRRETVANRIWCLIRNWAEAEFGDRWWMVKAEVSRGQVTISHKGKSSTAKVCETERVPCPNLETTDEVFRRELLRELEEGHDQIKRCPGVTWPSSDDLPRKPPPQRGVERLSKSKKRKSSKL